MKNLNFLFIFFLFYFSSSNAQITLNNWLIGGSGNIGYYETSSRTEYGNNNQSGYLVNLRPNVGYFFADRFAVGALVNLTFSNPEGSGNSALGYSIGPFIRYYLLNPEKTVNILTHAGFSYGEDHNGSGNKSLSKGYDIKAGPVIFLTKDVALEVTLDYNYSRARFLSLSNSSHILQLGIGLQIHLERY